MAWIVSGLGLAFLAYPAGCVGTHMRFMKECLPKARTLAIIHNSLLPLTSSHSQIKHF